VEGDTREALLISLKAHERIAEIVLKLAAEAEFHF